MPPLVKAKVGNIDMWVRKGPQAAWDVGTSHSIIHNDEYVLRHFVDAPVRDKVHTVVDVGANIGAFTLLARRVFPNARVIAIEPDPANASVLQHNCGNDELVTICETAVLDDGCPETVHLCRHDLNSGGSYVHDLFEGESKNVPFHDQNAVSVPCTSIHDLLTTHGVETINLLKVDTEGSEVAVFSCLSRHGWLEKTTWIRFEWHGREAIPRLRRLLSPTHEVSIDERGLWNALGIAHRKEQPCRN
jgi:FkbM family methyltransferase